MVDKAHLKLLSQGVDAWNQWREENPRVKPELSGASLKGKDLAGINLDEGNIRGTSFKKADLTGARFRNAEAGQRWWDRLCSVAIALISFAAALFHAGVVALLFGFLISLHPDGTEYTIHPDNQTIIYTILFFLIIFLLVVGAAECGKLKALAVALVVAGIVASALMISMAENVTLSGAETLVAALVLPLLLVALIALTGALAAGSALALYLNGAVSFIYAMALAVFLSVIVVRNVTVTVGGIGAVFAVGFSLYCTYRILRKGEPRFSLFQKLGLFMGTAGGTDFRGAILRNADFTNALLRNTRFDKTTDLTNVYWDKTGEMKETLEGRTGAGE